ncbi:MAG: hypothetical protein ACLFU8_17625, partial [Anaerolineales bacterium]
MPDDVKRNVDTEGGAAVDGSVNAGGDFVGRDQETHVSAEDHSVAVGRDLYGGVHNYYGTLPSSGAETYVPPPRGRCDDYRHISLPPHYIPRPDLLRQTREAVLACPVMNHRARGNAQAGSPRWTVIRKRSVLEHAWPNSR